MSGFFPNSVNNFLEGQIFSVSCCKLTLKQWRWMHCGERPQKSPPASRASFKHNSKVSSPWQLWYCSDPQESSHHSWLLLLSPERGGPQHTGLQKNVLQLLCRIGKFRLRALWKSGFPGCRWVYLGSFNKLLPGFHQCGRGEDSEGLQGMAPGTPPGQLLALFWFCWDERFSLWVN